MTRTLAFRSMGRGRPSPKSFSRRLRNFRLPMSAKDIDSPFVGSNHARELSFSVASIPVAESVHFPLASACDFVETGDCHIIQFPKRPAPCGLFQFLGSNCSQEKSSGGL